MKVSELNRPLFESDTAEEEEDELNLQWDEVDSFYNPDQFEIKQQNQGLETEEDQPNFSNKPESEELASNGHRGLKDVTRYL